MNMRVYKHNLLGFIFLSLMSFEAFAETRGSSLFGNHHSGQLTLDAVYGDKKKLQQSRLTLSAIRAQRCSSVHGYPSYET